jgi:hypothetical protein
LRILISDIVHLSHATITISRIEASVCDCVSVSVSVSVSA